MLDRLAGVVQQRLLEGRIGPGLGDDLRAVARADLGLVGLDDGIERRRIDIALFGQDGLERAHPQLGLREFGMVVIVVVVVMSGHTLRIGKIQDMSRCRTLLAFPHGGQGNTHSLRGGSGYSVARER